MPDEIQTGQDIVVKEDTQVDMPATETKPEELPQEASERTKQEFEKLKAKNKELAEKLARHEQEETNSLLDSLTKPVLDSNPPQGQVENIVQNLTDENGYIDEALLKKTLQESSQTANQAVQAAKLAQESARKSEERISKYEQNEQVKKAYTEFPQADPENDNFDPRFVELVKNEMIGQAMNRVKPNFYEACKKWSSFTQTVQQPNTEKVVAKEQINAGGTNTKPSVNHDSLVEGTRKGDHNSIAARLAASGF